MKKHFYGGQAVIEGVMIRGMKNCVVAVRNKNQEIIINQIKLPSFTNSYFKKIPFIRGLFILVEMMVIGFRALSKSSEIIDQIGGWTFKSVGQGYGNGYCLKILAKWMNSITRE